jgi:hypothetical protein
LSWLAGWGVVPRVASTGTGNRREEEKREMRPEMRKGGRDRDDLFAGWVGGWWLVALRCRSSCWFDSDPACALNLRSTNAHAFHAPRLALEHGLFWKHYFFRHSVRGHDQETERDGIFNLLLITSY